MKNRIKLNTFLESTFFPLLARKWKESTLATNRDRIVREIGGTFGERRMDSLSREELQSFLDSKARLSYSTTAHLRWDLRQIFELAVAEGVVTKNPALMLFVPRACAKPKHLQMSMADVRLAIIGLDLRERLVFKLATVAGLRPGEIFGLRRGRVFDELLEIRERIYRGAIDTPKTERSVRSVALAETLREDMVTWLAVTPDTGPEAWLFPSGKPRSPLSKDNFMARYMRPALKRLHLEFVTFQVMRRTHASLMRELKIDPKIVADSLGHNIGTSLDVYTITSIESRLRAAETLNCALVN